MSTADLHSRIAVEIERRLAVARAASPYPPADQWTVEPTAVDRVFTVVDGDGNWVVYDIAERVIPDHVALHDPADAERRYSAALRVLNRHWRNGAACEACWRITADLTEGVPWPCPEIRDLAASLGLDITEGNTTDG